jgi:small neutral amino acid transporter SnatA (MarC family)
MVILGGVLLIAFALLLTAGTIYRLIRPTGISVFSQVIGIVLAIIAVDLVLAT